MPKKFSSKQTQIPKEIKQPPQKKTPVKKVTLSQPETFVNIDHPTNGEIIGAHHYSIRISTNASGKVDISIDGGDWQPCRSSVGFWWFDWHHIPSGSHKIVVRIVDDVGFIANKSKITRCDCR